METVLVTGGTGLVGRRICQVLLAEGYRVLVATRHLPHPASLTDNRLTYILWDPTRHFIDVALLSDVDHIINLAGAGVAEKRWTKQRKEEIVQSRVDSGRTIVKALSEHATRVRTVIQASAIGWYGPDHDPVQPFVETDPMDHAYLGTTCGAWENSVATLPSMGIRLVTLRIGIVLSAEGGALKEFMKPLRWGVAPVFGSGKQVVSWIHVDDLCRLMVHTLHRVAMEGVYNAVAPDPVPQRSLIKTLAQQMKPPCYIMAPIPAIVLQGMLGEMSIEILKSATVDATKTVRSGFSFTYSTIEKALHHLVVGTKDSTNN